MHYIYFTQGFLMVSLLLIAVSAAQECGGTCSFNSIVCITIIVVEYKAMTVVYLSQSLPNKKIMCT